MDGFGTRLVTVTVPLVHFRQLPLLASHVTDKSPDQVSSSRFKFTRFTSRMSLDTRPVNNGRPLESTTSYVLGAIQVVSSIISLPTTLYLQSKDYPLYTLAEKNYRLHFRHPQHPRLAATSPKRRHPHSFW